MLKKIAIGMSLATLLALPLAAQAKPLVCPFTDYFALSAPGNVTIIGTPSVTGNLKYAQQSATFFNLSCANSSSSNAGDLSISLGADQYNKCDVVIHDGPYVMNPSVTSVYCIGKAQYNGMEHNTGSYTYTLKIAS